MVVVLGAQLAAHGHPAARALRQAGGGQVHAAVAAHAVHLQSHHPPYAYGVTPNPQLRRLLELVRHHGEYYNMSVNEFFHI